jgi:hypothetical protein
VVVAQRQASELKEFEDMTVDVWAVDRLCHLVMKEIAWVVGVVSVVALLCRALPDQLRNHSVGNILLLGEQARGNRDIFWQCSARRTGCLNRFLGRS